MFDLDKYRNSCSKLIKLFKYGRAGIYIGGYELLGADVFGHQIIIDSRHYGSLKTLYCPPSAEVSVIAFMLEYITPGMIVVDVGSGCGYYTIIASSFVGEIGEVYSFEAIPECFKLLQKNLRLNDIDNVKCINRLIANETKKVSQKYFGENYEFFFLKSSEHQEKATEVETISLDQYFQDKQSRIDFVKINDEKLLPAILKGMDGIIDNNRDIKILCLFNKNSIVENEGNLDEFFDHIESKKLEIFLFPNLSPIDKEDLLEYTITKNILLSRSK